MVSCPWFFPGGYPWSLATGTFPERGGEVTIRSVARGYPSQACSSTCSYAQRTGTIPSDRAPPPGQDRCTPPPKKTGYGYPPARIRVPPLDKIWVHPQPGKGCPPGTGYAAGSTPLAVTQEDCLVNLIYDN